MTEPLLVPTAHRTPGGTPSPSPSSGVDGDVIVAARGVTKAFTTPDGAPLPVLEDITLELREGEIVALLGRSGSGKSTLLRCMAGLVEPTSGEVQYRGRPLSGPNPGVAMVFQSFALLPWLTVLQNVELGLEARGVAPAPRREKALAAIDLVGLDGFESAYPKELSGGMRQRVGFARAVVVQPDALFMDEPFSALDVLTAENLRSELLDLWDAEEFPTKAMLLVTHNIEEAVALADRIVILSANPGRIRAEFTVTLDRPRDRRLPAFEALVDHVYRIMTGREERAERPERAAGVPAAGEGAPVAAGAGAVGVPGAPGAPGVPGAAGVPWAAGVPGAGGAEGEAGVAAGEAERAPSPTELPLPPASVGGMAGLLEILVAVGGREDLPDLAHDLNFEVDDLLPLVDAAVLLGFAEVDHADMEITADGRRFVSADILDRKEIFAASAGERAPLVRAIWRSLRSSASGHLDEGFFVDSLRRGFSEEEARHQLDIAIDWGRYAELFAYDADSGRLTLDVGDPDHPA